MPVSDNQAPLNSGEDHEQLSEHVDRRFRRVKRIAVIAFCVTVPVLVIVAAVNASNFNDPQAEQYRERVQASLPDVVNWTDDEVEAAAAGTCSDIRYYGSLSSAVDSIYQETDANYWQSMSVVAAAYHVYCPAAA